MKKIVAFSSIGLVLIVAISLFMSREGRAQGYQNPYTGVVYGNICRNGIYYQFLPGFAVVGATCYMPAWGGYGAVSTW